MINQKTTPRLNLNDILLFGLRRKAQMRQEGLNKLNRPAQLIHLDHAHSRIGYELTLLISNHSQTFNIHIKKRMLGGIRKLKMKSQIILQFIFL